MKITEEMVRRITLTILGHDVDHAEHVNWHCNRTWRRDDVREHVRQALEKEFGNGGWQPPETAPRDGKPFEITTTGPEQDICCWHENEQCFRDYYFKQKILMEWPYMIGWRPLRDPAKVGNSKEESRRLNGW